MGERYYWAGPRNKPIKIGDVVEAGNWGKLFREMRIAYNDPFHYIGELVYETIRLKYYSEQISRLEAFFFFDNIDNAVKFANLQSPARPLFKIALLDENPKIDHHVMDDFDKCPYKFNEKRMPITSVLEVAENARRYWSYVRRPNTIEELLTDSKAIVIERL
jgi:hypothetical protein